MNNGELKKLEDDLWDAANSLRAYGGIKASDYAVPVLGLIFLRFAENKYSQVESEIIKEFENDKGTRLERAIENIAIEKCGFYLPPEARYEYLLNLPGAIKTGQAIKEAMEAIEKYQNPGFKGVLPKDPYFEIEKKKEDILPQLLKAFSDIPKDASGDVFGKIYEYFLGKFALSEGQKGGEFFTPTSVVRFIVETIEPFQGNIFDPACGSGGMFVQSANFLSEVQQDRSKIYVEGQEFMGETVRLAKMNLMVNNLRGEIAEVNSYETDQFGSLGKYDYVMANPPFNVKGIQETTVKNDKRFTTYGLPKPKGKKEDKITDANYLWISLFATSLNDKGRAGFVMANSASDARNAEYEIRKKIVDSGIVDCMVTIPSNMFYTVTLPATLWFFDKGKRGTDREKKILFIDARNTFRQIDRAHRDWTEEQIQNLAAIVRMYRGETARYLELIARYIENAVAALKKVPERIEVYRLQYNQLVTNLQSYVKESKDKHKPAEKKNLVASGLLERLEKLVIKDQIDLPDTAILLGFDVKRHANTAQLEFAAGLNKVVDGYRQIAETLKKEHAELLEIYKQAGKLLRVKQDKQWGQLELVGVDKVLESNFAKIVFEDEVKEVRGVLHWPIYWYETMHWLQSRFPDAVFADVVGLCKVAERDEYVDEQDYSLNAGRYVGIKNDDDVISYKEFEANLRKLHEKFNRFSVEAREIEDVIEKNIRRLL
ncbi:type I restriction-modification system subunit M [Desulfocastanea catecholica]